MTFNFFLCSYNS